MAIALHPLIKPPVQLTVTQLRQQLGDVLERVHFDFAQFQIVHKGKTKARLVNELCIQALDRLVPADPALAKTLELQRDQDFPYGIV